MGHPEAALVGEIADGRCFFADVAPHGIPVVGPPGGLQILENFLAIGQVHECATQVVFEIAVPVFGETRVLGAGSPTTGLGPPHRAFGFGMFAVVSGEDEGGTHGATRADAAERGPAIAAVRNLHQAIEHKERGLEAEVGHGLVRVDFSGIGVKERDRLVGFALLEEGTGHVTKFLRKIKGVNPSVAEGEESHRDAARATPGFEDAGIGRGRQVLREHLLLRIPQAQLVRGAGVVDHGAQVVEVSANLLRGDLGRWIFFNHR